MPPSAPPSPLREQCESVLVVEKAPEYFRGGNTYFTGGIIRFAFNGIDDIKALIPDMSETEENSIEVGQYTEDHVLRRHDARHPRPLGPGTGPDPGQ